MVACPAENTWMRYAAGGLEPEIEQHLDDCESCRFMFVNLAKGSGDDATVPAKLIPIDLSATSEHVRGALIDRYVVLGTLGRGGMGVVYKAFDPELDRPVALKLVAVNGVGSDADESRARLLREAKTLAQLSHPNIVAVHDVGSHDGDVFVAMEFVAGQTLRRWLDGTRTPREILAVFRAAANGLAAAHALGIVHRDFKPENVIVGDDGRVRVLDFGLARPGERSSRRPSLPSITPGASMIDLTRAGAIMGTPAYMAPEQDLGNGVDGRSDQFSFCAALYEALYRQRPFDGRNYTEIADNRLAGDVRQPPAVRGVSSRVRRALLRGLRVEPSERHASMNALLVDLGAPRKRLRLAIAALVLTTIGAGGWAAWVATHRAPSTDELCQTAASEVERVWTPKRRADLIASLDKLNAHDRAIYVADGFDRYTGDWRAKRIGLCKRMMNAHSETSRDDLASAQLQCLKRNLNKVDAYASVLIHAPTLEIANRSHTMIDELPPLADCEGTDLTRVVNEGVRERWKPLLQDLVTAQTALGWNQLAEAQRLARSVIKRAGELGEVEPAAPAWLILGQAQVRSGAPVDETLATLKEAVRAATLAREDGMVVDAWIEMLSLAFTNRTLLPRVDEALFGATIAALRLSEHDERQSKLAYMTGTLELLRGNVDNAIASLRRAIAAYGEKRDSNAVEIAAVENSLGAAFVFRGDFAEARTTLEKALATWEALGFPHPNRAHTIGWFGELELAQHHYEPAEAYYVKQLELFKSLGKLGEPTIGPATFQLAYLYTLTGRCKQAEPLIADARRRFVAAHGSQSSYYALTLLAEGECALAAGNATEAVTLLEEARRLEGTPPAALFQPARTAFALARALVAAGKDKPRAIALAEHARSEYARFGGARLDRDAVEAWLSTRR